MVYRLPDIVLLKVFSFLSGDAEDLLRVRQVCRHWRELTEVKSLWQKVGIIIDHCHSEDDDLARKNTLAYRCLAVAPVLKSVNLLFLQAPCDSFLSRISRLHPYRVKVQQLELECMAKFISSDDLSKILFYFSQLESLDLSVFCDMSMSSSPLSIGYLPQLKTFRVDNHEFEFNGPPGWPQLEELCLPRSCHISISTDGGILRSSQESLKRLRFAASSRFGLFPPGLQDLKFPNLESLEFVCGLSFVMICECEECNSLPSSANKSEYVFLNSIQSFYSISELKVSFLPFAWKYILQFLKNAPPKLMKISLIQNGCWDSCKGSLGKGNQLISASLEHSPNLKSLDVSFCTTFGDSADLSDMDLFPSAKCKFNLRPCPY